MGIVILYKLPASFDDTSSLLGFNLSPLTMGRKIPHTKCQNYFERGAGSLLLSYTRKVEQNSLQNNKQTNKKYQIKLPEVFEMSLLDEEAPQKGADSGYQYHFA